MVRKKTKAGGGGNAAFRQEEWLGEGKAFGKVFGEKTKVSWPLRPILPE